MTHDPQVRVDPAAVPWLSGGGEMGAVIRALDWAQTPIGPPASWSPSLRMMVRFLLSNRFPLLLWWGPHFCQLYNDPYRPVLGTKHPQSMGQPASACWPEIWHIIGPLIETPYHGGPATWMEDLALEINRHGFVEETHFTVAYSPVPDETVPSGIGGVLATVHEISDKVVGERRVAVLRDLGARASEAKTAADACAIAAETLAQHPQDIPFALLYLLDADNQCARLAGATGISQETPASPHVIALSRNPGTDAVWPLADTVRTETMQIVDDLAARTDHVPPGPWVDPPQRAAVVPIRSNMAHQLAGVRVIGLSARLRFDELYASFLELATTQVATAIANARAYEAERQRAEALAELDRAKTAFFSNISHEFRTPLTLMLGPLEQALAGEHGALTPSQREELDVVQRNGLRLLKLVNTLLDFSRLEAGRIDASYEPLDLAACTVDLASVFRSAIERAGLRLRVECPSLPEAIYVDRDMWEKIVLNLLSNALKFTFEGEIAVSLRWCGTHVELAVRDTGIGIPAEELPHLFERFHRIRGARARTHEGTGIGLALVQELVKLHGGQIAVASTVGAGTTFTLAIPTGTAHLPADRVDAARSLASTTLGAEAFVEKALRWLPEEPEGVTVSVTSDLPLSRAPALPTPACILLVDDNADMRDYVRRLLAPRWEVVAVADGLKALEVAGERGPDLVLTDVMMPGLDGFALLRALRADPRTAPIPVILLSARAGEESRLEGLEAGADDYLIKPFSARELLARVEASLKLHRLRRETSAREQTLREEAQAARQRLETILATLEQRVEERTALLALIQDVTRAANEAPNSPVALQYAVDRLCAYTDWPIGHVYLAVAPGADRWAPSAIWHLDTTERYAAFQQATQALECAAGVDLIGRVGARGQPEWLRDVGTDPTFARRHAAQEVGLSTGVAWPILVGPEVAGVLECYTPELLAPNPALLEAMSQMSLQLGRAIERERAAARVQQQQEALVQREKLAAMSTMLASVAHELNNPLASIVLQAELLGEDVRGGALAEPVAEITQAAARCERLVRQFLTLARQHPPERAVVALNTLVAETVELLAYPLRVDNVTVHLHLDDQLPPLWGDAHQLQQVLINLLTNAQQALRAAPGVREVTVTTQYDPAQHQIALRVADTGPGMPPALQARIFEPFFTTKPPGVGTGLGLPLCRGIIEAHGGTLHVASVLGHGATFRLTLPVEAVPTLTPAPPSTNGEPMVRGRTILVVDDEPSLASGLARLLRRDSHTVDTVANGRLALTQLAERAYDLILCDVRMPELDGPSLYRFLERQQPDLCQRLIFLTGDTLEPATREFLEQSGAPCLTKPFTIADARRVIQRTLQGAVRRPEAPEV